MEIGGITINVQEVYKWRIIYRRPKLGNSVNSSFSMNKVSTLSNKYYSERVSKIHFERLQAPITPKYDGGYYCHIIKKQIINYVL